MKRAPKAPAGGAPAEVFPQATRGKEPTVYDRLESFKKELDGVGDLCRGGRWARAIRNIKDMQKDLGALANDIRIEYLEVIED